MTVLKWITLGVAALVLLTPLQSLGQEKKADDQDDPLAGLTEERRKRLGVELRDLSVSPKAVLKLTIAAPKTIVFKPSEKDPKTNVGSIEFDVKLENVGKEDFQYRPLCLDVAICDENGEEVSPKSWRWNKAEHGVTGRYAVKSGDARTRKVQLVVFGNAAQLGKTYFITACYISLTEGKYAVATIKSVSDKAEEKKK